MRIIGGVVVLLWAAVAASAGTASSQPLVIPTWGGSYQNSQRHAYFDPFTDKTGVPIKAVDYAGGTEVLRKQVASGAPDIDVVDMLMPDHKQACENGLLEKFDPAMLAPAPDGTPVRKDFLTDSFTDCGVAGSVFSMVYAFDTRAFPGERPYRIEHLFKPERFPGKRALHKRPDALLEWALISYGVPVADLYSLLSTKRGLRLAFKRLDRIRDQIVWWTDPARGVKLLLRDDVSFAMNYNGRLFNASVVQDKPIEVVWDAEVYSKEVWGVPKGADRPDLSRRFIRFATNTPSMAEFSRYIAYGPTRHSASRRLGKHVSAGVLMGPHMPTNSLHMDRAIRKDVDWYARTRKRLDERFDAWLKRGGESE